MALETLEQRLTDLSFDTPDAGRISARVLSLVQKPRRRAFPRWLALGVATLLVAGGVLYFVPAADAGLADAPIAGDLLRDAGLTGAGTQVTSVGAVASSSGFRLQLIGAYADSTRTVLLLRANPAVQWLGVPGNDIQLTDQFGRSYNWQSGQTDSRTGQAIVQFEALAWPDALTGARITVKVAAVERACLANAFCSSPLPDGPVVKGSWVLPATLGVDEGTALALPAAAQLGAARFQFTSVRSSTATIGIDIQVTGVTFDDLGQMIPDGGKGTAVFTIDLFSPTGDVANTSFSMGEGLQGPIIQFLAYRSGPGEYRLHISYRGSSVDRILTVP
ncbi:MAG TPA: hypothetical protein VND96_19880 [Candidatus Micrarchaeaceae archaeon]|nr:hypothetical protein [Candidatus Micrarchaeaceae archaeon]